MLIRNLVDGEGDGYVDDASFTLQSITFGGQAVFDPQLVTAVIAARIDGPADAFWAGDGNSSSNYSALQQLFAAADPTNPTGLRSLGTLPGGVPWWQGVLNPYAGLPVDQQDEWQNMSRALSDLQSLIALQHTRDPLFVASFITSVANRATQGDISWLHKTSGALSTLSSVVEFAGALERGDFLRAAVSGGNLAQQGLSLYRDALIEARNEVIREAAAQGGGEIFMEAATQLNASITAVSSALDTLGEALPYLNVLLKLGSDPVGAIINLIAIAAEAPVIGWIYAAFKLIEMSLQDVEIGARASFVPSAGATGVAPQITWAAADGGQAQAQAMMAGLLQPVADVQAKFPGTMAVAERLPRLEFKGLESGGGWITLTFTDATTGVQSQRTYSLTGDWIGEGGSISVGEYAGLLGNPVGTIAGDSEYFDNMHEQFVQALLNGRAIVADWQAATISAQRARGDVQAALTPEQRAVMAGHLYTQAQADAATANFKPIVLDLDGGGITIAPRGAGMGVQFDTDANGSAQASDWPGPRKGILVIDRDGSGDIDSAASNQGFPFPLRLPPMGVSVGRAMA